MARYCENCAPYDEAGICGCGAGHKDPDAWTDDMMRLAGENRMGVPSCGFCDLPIEGYDHSACPTKAIDGLKPN